MRVIHAATIIALLASPASAQQQAASPPPFVPYVITQDVHVRIMNYLGEQPTRIALPLMQILTEIQQQAIREKIAKDAKAIGDGKIPKEARTPDQPLLGEQQPGKHPPLQE